MLGRPRAGFMRLILLTFFLSASAQTMPLRCGKVVAAAHYRSELAQLRRAPYTRALNRAGVTGMADRGWETTVPRTYRWITHTIEESRLVHAFANAFFLDFQDYPLLISDTTDFDSLTERIAARIADGTRLIFWVAVAPSSTLQTPSFDRFLEMLSSLVAAKQAVAVIYERDPTPFDIAFW